MPKHRPFIGKDKVEIAEGQRVTTTSRDGRTRTGTVTVVEWFNWPTVGVVFRRDTAWIEADRRQQATGEE